MHGFCDIATCFNSLSFVNKKLNATKPFDNAFYQNGFGSSNYREFSNCLNFSNVSFRLNFAFGYLKISERFSISS